MGNQESGSGLNQGNSGGSGGGGAYGRYGGRSDNSQNTNSANANANAVVFTGSLSEVTNVVVDDTAMVDFGEKVTVAYTFWKTNVDRLPRGKQQKLGILLFANLFKKQPLCRQLFMNADIAKQSLRLLDMFAWLLKSMVKDKNHMRVRTLKSVGQRHVTYGVKREYFGPMLDSLNEALLELCSGQYTPKIRVALTLLFQSACNEMMKYAGYPENQLPFMTQNESFQANNQSYTQKYRFLRSIDHTLADPMGFAALEGFLKKLYCSELTEFHKAYRIYRCCLAPAVRKEIATEIIKLFLTQGAQLELNDGSENRNKIVTTVQNCADLNTDYPLQLFDETHVWVKFQISQNWVRFKSNLQQ